jgi:hypothetical protein
MTYEEQTKLIKELVSNVQNDILKESIHYPAKWDGIELRWRIVDVFSQVVFSEFGKRKGTRYNEYKNDRIIYNLI